MRTITLLSATIVSVGLSAPALSAGVQRDVAQVTQVVRFADLDLSRPEGAETLYQRVEGAARRVCQGASDPLNHHRAIRARIDQAVGDAIVQLNDRPQVVAVHLKATQPATRRTPKRESRRA